MDTRHIARGGIAALATLAALGFATLAAAQPAAPQTSAPSQFAPGTETTATYPLPDSNGGTLTVHAGMPEETRQYGPPPAFATLDANHDGRISEAEARAYPPLDSDFLFASGGAASITKAQYQNWVKTQH